MYLYFEHSNGHLSFVAECTEEEVWQYITRYINKLNHNYKVPYIRSWREEDNIIYDVGSWSEFFKLTPEKKPNISERNGVK